MVIQSCSPQETVLYVLEKKVALSNMWSLQGLLPPKVAVTDTVQEAKIQLTFLLLQEMIQIYFQPFL